MNQEMPMEKEFSSEGEKIEAIINKTEDTVEEGKAEAETLAEDRSEKEGLEFFEGKKLELLTPEIQEKLRVEKSMEMPEN